MTHLCKMQVEIYNQDFEVLWQDFGSTKKLTVFKDGKKIGSKEFSHLIDQGKGVVSYTIKSLILESGLFKSN